MGFPAGTVVVEATCSMENCETSVLFFFFFMFNSFVSIIFFKIVFVGLSLQANCMRF